MSPERTLFLRTGALGDFILSLPLLRELSRTGRPLCLVTRRAYADLLPPACRVERLIDVDGRAAAALFNGAAAAPPSSELASLLAGAAVYAFLRPDPELEAAWHRLGTVAVTWIDPRPAGPHHAAVSFLRQAGFAAPAGLVDMPLWPPSTRGRDLWIHAGSGSPAKNAPPTVFAEFADAWRRQRNDAGVVLSFGEADRDLASSVRDEFERRAIPFEVIDRPSLAELKRLLLARAGHYAGNDSGVSHLAAALGIPCTVWFRTTDQAVWRPLGACEVRAGIEIAGR